MRHGILFRRFFLTSIITVIMTALCTTVMFNFICRTLLTQLKENEMLPKANALGRITVRMMRGELPENALEIFMEDDAMAAIVNAYVYVTDAQGRELYHIGSADNAYTEIMRSAAMNVLSSGAQSFSRTRFFDDLNLVGVGVPIVDGDKTIGSLVMLMPLYEALIAMGSLNSTLIMSMFLCLPLTALLNYWVIGRIVRPLRQMRDISLRLANGDFNVRADDTQRGEIGQLGRTLNYMSQEVMRLLSTITLERNRLKQVLDGLNEGIVAVDRLGKVTLSNPAVSTLFKDIPLRDVESAREGLIPLKEIWEDMDTCVETGEGMERLVEAQGRMIQASITPLHDKTGETMGAVALFSDVTERERLERTRRDYVANVSHELRSPLTAMRALVEPLNEDMVKDEAARKRYYGIILREIMRLTRLINDLMELSRLQSGTLSMEKGVVRTGELLQDLEEKYSAKAESQGLRFIMTESAAACPDVYTNADRLEQLLVILLDNAMKYTPEGGTVTLDALDKGDIVEFSVQDTGIGISKDDIPYIFDRFYKVDKAHSGMGSGLGLSIAKEMLERLGETISVTSEEGKGTQFHFTMHTTRQQPCVKNMEEENT